MLEIFEGRHYGAVFGGLTIPMIGGGAAGRGSRGRRVRLVPRRLANLPAV